VQNKKARLFAAAGVDSCVGVDGLEHRPSQMGAMMTMVVARDGVCHKPTV
jgi:hypothetical protein